MQNDAEFLYECESVLTQDTCFELYKSNQTCPVSFLRFPASSAAQPHTYETPNGAAENLVPIPQYRTTFPTSLTFRLPFVLG